MRHQRRTSERRLPAVVLAVMLAVVGGLVVALPVEPAVAAVGTWSLPAGSVWSAQERSVGQSFERLRADGDRVVGVRAEDAGYAINLSTDGGRTMRAPVHRTGAAWVDLVVAGNRAYVLANPGDSTMELDVWDTATRERVATYPVIGVPGQDGGQLAVDGDTVVVAARSQPQTARNDAIMVSVDGGQDWEVVLPGIDADGVAVAGDDVAVMYEDLGDLRAVVSHDRAVTWPDDLELASGPRDTELMAGPAGFVVAYTGSDGLMTRRSADGTVWSKPTTVSDSRPSELTVSSSGDGYVIGVPRSFTPDTMFLRSVDGRTWKRVDLTPRTGGNYLAFRDRYGQMLTITPTRRGLALVTVEYGRRYLVRSVPARFAPRVRITHAPSRYTDTKLPVIGFEPANPSETWLWECASDLDFFKTCASPYQAEILQYEDDHRVRVRAMAAADPSTYASTRWALDLRPPVGEVRGRVPKVTLKPVARFRWKRPWDASGIAHYDLRVTTTSQRAGRMSQRWRRLKATQKTERRIRIQPGTIVCLQVRPNDRFGRVGRWRWIGCSARMFTDDEVRIRRKARVVRGKRYVDRKAILVESSTGRSVARPSVVLPRIKRGSKVYVLQYVTSTSRGFWVKLAGKKPTHLRPKAKYKARKKHLLAAVGRSEANGAVRLNAAEHRAHLDGLAVRPRWVRGSSASW
ncbi:hypothetical protein CLV56_0146 [Mumia flava]|uniref:Uncharacterized protein n=1 Tax=Mumia flava TaxID=1348852 RepID=A0A0B2BHS5_9ACTN|nr:hypothetical protein [Mumia flava]PJJ55943.1 hypothetical protein CLV56_0146 [Mumia flava]